VQIWLVLFFIVVPLYANENNTTVLENNSTQKPYIDHVTEGLDMMHGYVSHKVKVVSSNIDEEIADIAHNLDGNESTVGRKTQKKRDENVSASMSEYFSGFFKDETFLNSNTKSYVRLRLGPEFYSKEKNKMALRASVSLDLPHTKDSVDIFFGEDIEDELSDKAPSPEAQKATLGIRYYIPEFLEDLKSDISVGVRGIDPFVKLYFKYTLDYASWRIYPTQEFRYSADDNLAKWGYEEKTRLYFDRRISPHEMVRILLRRSSEEERYGQRYGMTLSYFNTLNKRKTGINTYVSISGDSFYFKNHPDYIPDGHEHSGIDNYRLGFVWKKGIYKDWLFAEIEPLVEWDRKYYFDENYVLKTTLELWFGTI
jgi:hypothetical protein